MLSDANGDPTQFFLNLPFGETMTEQTNGAYNNPYKFNAKELDAETGFYYYGARYYNPRTSVWLSVDPLAEQTLDPYGYTYQNPINLVDPTGMSPDDVIIKGTEKQTAFDELQASVKSELSLTMDAKGKISYKQNDPNKVLSSDAQQLVDAIDDNSITVNLDAQNDNYNSDGSLRVGGSFMGNTVSQDSNGNNIVDAKQEINPHVLKKLSNANKKPGADTLHEVTEAYQGAKISQKSGVSSLAANKAGTVYKQAHNLATPQSGIISAFYTLKGKQTKRKNVSGALRIGELPGPTFPVIYNLGDETKPLIPSDTQSIHWHSNNVEIQRIKI